MLPDYEDNQDSVVKTKLQEFLYSYRFPLVGFLTGAFLLGLGIFFWKGGFESKESGIEVLEASSSAQVKPSQELVVEISGEVEKPGVYKMQFGSRIEDLLKEAGGVTKTADTEWIGKTLNRASKLSDGQKVYIPKVNEQTKAASANSSSGESDSRTIILGEQIGLININEATQNKLEELPGIGPVYAKKIIEQRPYSTIDELISKGVMKESLFEKIKEKISVY